MIEELPKAVSQEQVSHEVGPMKIKPISMLIPPREKSKRTLYKKGRPAKEAIVEGAEQMPEEPNITPLLETHKRREVERVYEAVRKAREIGQASTYKRKEKTVDPERRTKTKEDPREVKARGEREETKQAQKGQEALGREGVQGADEQEPKGIKRTREELTQQMHEAAENIERLTKMLKTGEPQESEHSQTFEEAQQFVEGLIHTPSSQREQKEGGEDEEVMQAAPSESVIDIEPIQGKDNVEVMQATPSKDVLETDV